MRFNELKENAKGLVLDTLRRESDNYFEAVVSNEELDKFIERLEGSFGEPAWPSEVKLAPHIEGELKGFGGLMPGQTLYYKNEGTDQVFVMFWPWQDGQRTTFKMVCK